MKSLFTIFLDFCWLKRATNGSSFLALQKHEKWEKLGMYSRTRASKSELAKQIASNKCTFL
jgi:hypothetical protein